MFAGANHESSRMKGMRSLLFELPIVMVLTLLITGSGGFLQNVYGATAVVGKVTATSGNVRTEASTSSGVAFCVGNGDEVAVLGKGKAKDGTVWYKVSIGDQTGYIRSDLVSITDKTIEVSDSLVPGNEKAQATSATDNTNAANATDNKTTDENTQADTSDSKRTGTPGSINASYVRMRSSASTSSNVVKYLDLGASVEILGEGKAADSHIWYQIRVGEDVGFVRSDFVNKTDDTTSQNGDNATGESDENSTGDADNTENGQTTDASTDETAKNPEDNVAENQEVAPDSTENVQGAEGTVRGTAVRVRNTPVTGAVVCQLSNGHPVVVTGLEQGSDGTNWYGVTFSYMGNVKTGFIRSDFVTKPETVETETAELGDEDFENMISSFPDSYKNSLRVLHKDHPNWRFEMVNTGLEWNDALTAESSVGKNLVTKNSVASWKSTATQAYNKASNTWYTFDGGSWVSASSELIAFYMDPRNFLNDEGVFQFEELNYNENQNADGVNKMLAGTFMASAFTDTDGNTGNYADVFVMAGQAVGISPYLLAGRAVQEQGINGQSQSISGVVPGYEGYFNYYNIGAYAYAGRTATINGLVYAKGTDETSLRPWNTRVKSIYGGSVYIADNFVKRGQDTLYFQKFNVVNAENTIYSHQYMSNIQAAASEAARLKMAYEGSDSVLTFKIPVYNNMPQTACVKPTSDASPNAYLESITVDGYELMPAFSGANEKYTVAVSSEVTSVTISAKAVSDASTVVGTGTYNLNEGSTDLYITCKAQNGSLKKYTITVKR